MSGAGQLTGWPFTRFALFVTGDGEREFLPRLFRPLEATGHCHFRVVHQLGQRSPIRAKVKQLEMVGRKKKIPDKDEVIGLMARKYLNEDFDFILLVDDLEHDRAQEAAGVYGRYRAAFDVMLSPLGWQARASVHFLVNMLEAYYFADAAAVNGVLGTSLEDFKEDVETIPHPKNLLKKTASALGKDKSFDEVKHGGAILQQLDVVKVLSRPDTCRSLRTAFAWCFRAMGLPSTDLFRLADGQLSPVTSAQLEQLEPVSG